MVVWAAGRYIGTFTLDVAATERVRDVGVGASTKKGLARLQKTHTD